MKSFLGGLGNLIIFLGELAVCGLLVLFLVLNPIVKKNAATEESGRKILVSDEQSNDRGLDAAEQSDIGGLDKGSNISQAMDLVRAVPRLEWMPGFHAPAKLWGYEGVYSSTDSQWVPGLWRTANMPSYQTDISFDRMNPNVLLVVYVPYEVLGCK